MNRSDSFVGLLVVVVLFALFFAFSFFMARKSCHATWSDSGMPVRWDAFAGCRVQRADGTWVPSNSVRELDP